MNACLGQTTLVSHKQRLFKEKEEIVGPYILTMHTGEEWLKAKLPNWNKTINGCHCLEWLF